MWIKKSFAEIPTNKHTLEVVEDLITTGSITDISLEIDDIGTENEYVKIMFKNKKRGSQYLRNGVERTVNRYIINTELEENILLELIKWYEETREKNTFSNSDYIDFKLREMNNNKITELKKIIEVKEDENRELNAIIDRLTEDNEELKEKFDASIIIIKSLMNRIYARNVTIRTAQKLHDRIIYCDTDSIHLIGTEIPNNEKGD